MPRSQHVSRRDFVRVVLTFLGTIMGAVVGLPAIGYLIAPAVKVKRADARIPLGPLENYPAGVPTLFNFTRTKVNGWEKTVNSYGVYVLRGEGDQVKVLSNVCTHLSCRVNWKAEEQQYACPCHAAYFDIDGKVLEGPPPRPLDEFEAEIEEGNLFINFVEG